MRLTSFRLAAKQPQTFQRMTPCAVANDGAPAIPFPVPLKPMETSRLSEGGALSGLFVASTLISVHGSSEIMEYMNMERVYRCNQSSGIGNLRPPPHPHNERPCDTT